MEEYQYTDVLERDGQDTTRVLTLLSGAESDTLTGTLAPMKVSDPGDFEALSYAWGSRSSQDIIICNGKVLGLTGNLGAALRKLRYRDRNRVIWADQICINQRNLVERSQQLKHMCSIYSKASKVLVWLGDDNGSYAKRAFAVIRSLAQERNNSLSLTTPDQEMCGLEELFPPDYWIALSELFKVSWFDRKWVLQETGTNSLKEIFWGEESVDWNDLSRASALIKGDHGYALRRQYDLLVWKPWYMTGLFLESSYKDKALDFTYELHRARWQLASDPRDHIFSLLGHPSARIGLDEPLVIEGDYTKPVEEVYHDFAVQVLGRAESLMILNVVQHDINRKEYLIPTWVPRWDDQRNLHNLLGDDTCPFKPSRSTAPVPKFEDSSKTLVIEGLNIDTISTMSTILDTSDFALNSGTVLEIWTQQCGMTVFDLEPKYLNGEDLLIAFIETLSAVKGIKDEVPISRSQRLLDGLMYLVKAFGGTQAVTEGVRKIGSSDSGGDCFKWMERVSGGAKNRRFAVSERGWYALCPPSTMIGDILCVLFGGRTLYCLRRSDNGYYNFIGECYVHGLMDGEALDMLEKGEIPWSTFKIR